jgi:hypothetical protein
MRLIREKEKRKEEMLMKNDKYDIDEILNEINGQTDDCLTEESFYPPSDNRYWESYVEDIDDGDNFADYCEYIFELLEEEGYYE